MASGKQYVEVGKKQVFRIPGIEEYSADSKFKL